MAQQSLSSSHEAYKNAFQTYSANSTVGDAIRNYAREAAAYIMQKMERNIPVFRVLGIGSGDGKPDLEILHAAARSLLSSGDENQKPLMHLCIVEPSSSLIADFKQAVSPLPEKVATLADVSFEWHEATFQEFISYSLPDRSKYHMIYFIASLFYMDAEKSLNYCFKNLAVGGAMFCLVAGTDFNYFVKQSRKFQGRLNCLSVSNFHLYTAKDLIAIAERNNWKYEELPTKDYEVDITSCFDKSSHTGGLLLDFLTHHIDFRETADPALYSDVITFITENSSSDNEGRKKLRSEMAIVVIYK